MVAVYLNGSDFVKPGWVSVFSVKWAINRAMQRGIDEPMPLIDDAFKEGALNPRDRSTFAVIKIHYEFNSGLINLAELTAWGRNYNYEFCVKPSSNDLRRLTEEPPIVDAGGTAIDAGKNTRPPQQQRFQEEEILRVIKELGYDALNLPVPAAGKRGVKSEVRAKLPSLNMGTVFDKAWDRLRAGGAIKDAS